MEAETSESGEVAEVELEGDGPEEMECEAMDLRGGDVSSGPLLLRWLQEPAQLCGVS